MPGSSSLATDSDASQAAAPLARKHTPQEIIDHIIGYIDPSDRVTLLSCCLTAHTFSPVATKLLFSRLHVTKIGFSSMVDQLRASRLKGSAVKSLVLTGLGLRTRPDLSGGELSRLFSCLEKIEKIGIDTFYLDTPSDAPFSLPNTTFLTTLTLKNVVFESMWGVLTLICSCTNLKTLNLSAVRWNNVRREALQQLKETLQPPMLRALDARMMKEDLVEYLFPTGDASYLETFGLQCRASGNSAWWRLLRHNMIWQNLRTLIVHDLIDSSTSHVHRLKS